MLPKTVLALLTLLIASYTPSFTFAADVVIDTPMSPPCWALLERELFKANTIACQEFFRRYFDERGYLECVERWGGDDGPDDAIENVNDWPLLHMLGGPDVVRELYLKAWEGHLRQYTAAKTTHVEFARDGMYYQEFPVMMDWLHNGEGLTVFNLQGLSDPRPDTFKHRVRRFADLYVPSPNNPTANTANANYDADRKLIRSMFNGSRGPLLRKATALDWAGDPIEVEGRFRPGHGERTYEEMLKHFEEYNDILGDHPQNLLTTSLAFNAFALTHDELYKRWLLEYVDAWSDRAAANNGILPSNIGRDGKIGSEVGGKWYGGVYGWGFTVTDPVTGKKVHRNSVRLGVTGFGNALLLTGDQKYVDVWRRQIDAVNSNAKIVEGKKYTPHMFGDEGWFDYKPGPWNVGAVEVAYWSMRDDDIARVRGEPGIAFWLGCRPTYPELALRSDLERVRSRVAALRADTSTPDTRLSDDAMHLNPCSVESLVRLTLGGLHPGKVGSPLHARLRYFDAERQRPGLPEDVAALVDKLTADEVGVILVNVSQTEPHTVIVQTGAYGEHQCESITRNEQTIPVNDRRLTVRLQPGCGERLTLRTKRYQNLVRFD
jgi:hypothetical protein